MTARSSLTRRLIATVLIVELLAALCISGTALVYERHAHFKSFDIMLSGRADSVLGAVQDAGDAADNVMLDPAELHAPADDVYEVRDASGRLVGRSNNWNGPPSGSFSPSADGFLRLRVNGRRFRAVRLHGLRIVDPGDKGGGTPRHVTAIYGSPIAPVWRDIAAAAQFYAFANLLLLLVTAVTMAWLLNRGLAPLRLLAAEASNISASSWRFDPPPAALRTRELAPLALALESVLQGLERSFLQQRRFIGDAAHELKTAVAVIKSSLQLLAMKPRTPDEYRAGLEHCETDCERMESLVFNMLTLASFDSADPKAPLAAPADLVGCIQNVAEQFENMATLHQVRIVAAASAPLPVRLSTQDCVLVLSNLLLNALQHSQVGSTVAFTAGRQGPDQVELRVEDHGPGIAPDALPHVFERFYRGDASRDRSTGGTGLGLAICKAIIEAAGGEIGIESTIGVGTVVIVRLPLAPETGELRTRDTTVPFSLD